MKMTDGDPSPPYVVEPGTRIRLVSDYSAAERRLGEDDAAEDLLYCLCWQSFVSASCCLHRC